MVMERLEALVDRAKGTLAAALTQRSRSADKSEATLPRGTKPVPPNTRDGSSILHSTGPKSEPRPLTHEESNMRGHYEGVPMQEYLAPNPHTVGVPVPDVHPSTPRRPPVHPRPGVQDRIGIPQQQQQQQQRPQRNPNNNGTSSNPSLARPSSAHPRHRGEYYDSDRQIVRENSGDRLYQEYGHQVASPGSLRPISSVSRSAESVRSERSYHSERRPRSGRRRIEESRSSTAIHHPRHSSEDRAKRRRSSSPPAIRRSRSRESERSRRQSGPRAHGSRELPSSPSLVTSSGIGRPVPSVYTISGRDYPDSRHPQQLQHIRHLQPVQPQVPQGPDTSEPLKWRDALRQALSDRDIKPIKPLLPTSEEVIDCLGQPQVIALVCGIITAFLMVLALSSSDWLLAVGWRQGLFAHCIGDGAPKPLPFQINADAGCHTARDEPYIMASAALCVICLLLDVFATLMTGLGLSSNDPAVKTRYYRIAVWVMTVALIAILIALILYPVFFAQELELGNRTLWEFGWAYGVGWGAAIFLFGAVVLLLCDQEEEEIYYKERTIIHAENDSRA